MKKPIVFFILCYAFTLAGRSEIPQALFDSANRLYEKSDFAEALELYHRMEKSNSNWKLYYNMGNCYFKLDQYVNAKIYFLKARRMMPFHASIEKNIRIVNAKFKDKISEKTVDFISKIWLKIESKVSLDLVSGLLIFIVLLLNFSIFFWIKRGKSKLLIYAFSLFLLLSILTSSYHVYRVKKQNTRTVAVIVGKDSDSQLRSGPGHSNTALFTVHPGLEVKIIERSGEWFQVSASSEIAGWIKEDELAII